MPGASERELVINPRSTLTFSVVNGSVAEVLGGRIVHVSDLTFMAPDRELSFDDLVITPTGGNAFGGSWIAESPTIDGGLMVRRVKAGFDPSSRLITISGDELRISTTLAEVLGDPQLAGVLLGSVTIRGKAEWVGGAAPGGGAKAPRGVDMHRLGLAPEGCDMTFCQLFTLFQPNPGREGDVVGLAVATTSWNIGTGDCIWWNIPDEEHPFIVMNFYRLKDGRFEQIGQSCIKHGFYALGSHQCGGPPCQFEDLPGHHAGDWLGMNCTDTYSAALNAVQSGMGPKYEANPWTGYWYYPGSHMSDGGHQHDNIQHRIQVHDADLDPAQNEGATYYVESFYMMLDDVDAMNSVAWKPAVVSGTPGGIWDFDVTGPSDYPNIGWAIDAWTEASQALLAQEIPVVEFESPDGRCVLAAKATDIGGGLWHYEYALQNVDMDRQVGSFSIPIPPAATVTNVGFHAVEHHDEAFNTADPDQVPIDNAPWDWEVTSDAVTWSTDSNPLRWSMLYNYRFDCDAPPNATTVTLGMFRAGTPGEVTGRAVGPESACTGDVNSDGVVGINDLLILLAAWGPNPGHPADFNGDDFVGINDLLILLSNWGPCPG
jgi:hypothetical protein